MYRAVIPDLLKFGYIPSDQVKLTDNSALVQNSSSASALPSARILDDEEHVLVLDFVESTKRYKSAQCVTRIVNQLCLIDQGKKTLILCHPL